jgi:hypothetical protein
MRNGFFLQNSDLPLWLCQIALTVVVASGSVAVSSSLPAQAKKEKDIPGISDHFKGIMSPENRPKMSDPLWERYFYAGKKALERLDISLAQRYFWAGAFSFTDLVKSSPNANMNDLARYILQSTVGLSGDVFFQDANPGARLNTPVEFKQPIEPNDEQRVDAELKKLAQAEADFDKDHPEFDGGARLRLIHLRRRMEFSLMMLPVLQQLFGTDDGITKSVAQHSKSDVSEYQDLTGPS